MRGLGRLGPGAHRREGGKEDRRKKMLGALRVEDFEKAG